MSASSPVIARQVHYSGGVQGVGFRYTTTGIARRFAVVGWVRNLPDGRVSLHVEGAAREVEAFLEEVRQRWRDHVSHEEIDPCEPTGRYTRFEIVR